MESAFRFIGFVAIFAATVRAQCTVDFAAPVYYPVGVAPRHLVSADVNGDGRPDLITANTDSDNVSVLLANADGTFMPASYFPCGLDPWSVAVADFNADTKPDLAVANASGQQASTSVAVMLGDGRAI